jgi:hypothetical protein
LTHEEDQELKRLVGNDPKLDWKATAQKLHNLTARQCKKRWHDFLSPQNNNEPWTSDENERLLECYAMACATWTELQKFLLARTSIGIRNRLHWLQKWTVLTAWLAIANDPGVAKNPELNFEAHHIECHGIDDWASFIDD